MGHRLPGHLNGLSVIFLQLAGVYPHCLFSLPIYFSTQTHHSSQLNDLISYRVKFHHEDPTNINDQKN